MANRPQDVLNQLIADAKTGLDNNSNPGASQEQATHAAVLALLSDLGGSRVQEDALSFEGTRFILPANYKGRLKEAAKFLTDHETQQETEQKFTRTFDYRPYDVANAVQNAMKKVFGTTGVGGTIQTMFGPIQPEFVTVATGVNTSTQVPWNRVEFPALSGYIDITWARSPKGPVGRIEVTAPRKWRSAVNGFFAAIDNELTNHSLYRGKAIINGEFNDIQFLDTSKVKREDVVYGDAVMTDLEANLWVPIRHTQTLRAAGQPVKRVVLLEGPYGTGKSLAGYLTAKEAVENGWTFIFAKPGSDLNEAMQTAKLYAPAVVFFEDIVVLQSNDPEAVSKLLDSFDGIGGKGQEVIGVLTTNNRDKIHKGMLRPGRLDALIHIADLDRGGVEKLIKASIPNDLLLDIDYDDVFVAVQGYLPAFVREVAARSYRYAMARTEGEVKALFTEDFVNAANSLREQFDLMTGAKEVQERTGLGAAMRAEIADVLDKADFVDDDGNQTTGDYALGLKINRAAL